MIEVCHGDAVEVMASMPAASVDAIVCDPPYGLEFMGRAWDSFGRGQAQSRATAGMTAPGYADGARRLERPTFLGGLNPRCTSCGRSQRGGSPCRCESPTFTDERGPRLRAFQEFSYQWATEAYRVLKPGGHLLAFGGTRTWHRLTCGVEDAGFEIRDTITWLYGSGFPKSLDVSKAIDKAAGATREVVSVRRYADGAVGHFADASVYGAVDTSATKMETAPATDDARRWQGWGTALKPASEPIVVARKPLAGTVAQTVLAHGTGALNIDGCRVNPGAPVGGGGGLRGGAATRHEGWQRASHMNGAASDPHTLGRWPSNVVLSHGMNDDGTDACAEECVPGCSVAELDEQGGPLRSGANPTRRGSDKFRDLYGEFRGQVECVPARGADSGGASRFFPTFRYQAKAPARERPRVDGVSHPTVKPLELMRWLIRLVTPLGGRVLDPFAGSGTTAEACLVEGFECVAIEREATYIPLIEARLARAGYRRDLAG